MGSSTLVQPPLLRLALPKGRMQEGVLRLLGEAGIKVTLGGRGYRPTLSVPGFETKLLKPQNAVHMLHIGSRDVGFAGADWVAEQRAELVELLDTGLDPVRLVAAAPAALVGETGGDGAQLARLASRPLVVASEYERLTTDWITRRRLQATFVRSYGATEVFPPEDADCIVDNAATGSTLAENGLIVVDELMRSSTRLYANPRVMDDVARRSPIEDIVLLTRAVLEARQRVMLEVNVDRERLEAIVAILPSMREPTIAPLHGNGGYAVKSAVRRADLHRLVPQLKAAGGSDIVVTALAQIVP